jgi:tRNA pseudouridine38-40 synthase
MTRFKLLIEYDGGPFVGWQCQENGPSVQEALEDAVYGFCGERVRLTAAGRTDAGVHALGQVAHLDLQRETAPDKLRDALNAHLRPAPIAVLAAEAAPPDFHARFSATRRSYLYRIANRRAPLALDRGRAWFVPVPLDADAMHEAAQALVGRHDFSSFRAAECQADSPVKTLDRLSVSRHGEELRVDASARSFLHHQVRNLVGSLKLVGQGKWDRAKLEWVLARKDRAAAGPTAPSEGLYFVSAGYE